MPFCSTAHNVFKVIDIPMNNSAARQACQELGMDLVVLPTQTSHCQAREYSKTHGTSRTYWTGLYFHSNVLVWADGGRYTWWKTGDVSRKYFEPCYVLGGNKRVLIGYSCDVTHAPLCGKNDMLKVMRNLPNFVSVLRSDLLSYIYSIEIEDPYRLDGDVPVQIIEGSRRQSPFRVSQGSVYIPEQTTLPKDAYVLELKASFSCGGEETSFLCVSVFDVVIGETTPSPLCSLGQTDDEPLQFLIPETTRDQMCTALPLLDFNDPGSIIVAILYLQFTIDRSMFPYIFRIFARDKSEVVTFLYSHCKLYPPTTPAILTTEPELQTTPQPDIICLGTENNTILFPASIAIGNQNLQFTTFENLNSTCDSRDIPAQGGDMSTPSSQKAYESVMTSDYGVVCVSWLTTGVTMEVVVADDTQRALMQKGAVQQATRSDECDEFSCWNKGYQAGVIVVSCVGICVIVAGAVLVYKKIRKRR
ncbi:hypothetical protein ScPMuIL_013774 [Solemya velum]